MKKIDLRKLGCDVAIVGKAGNDNLGKFLINKLKEEGVNTEGIKVTDKTNSSGTAVLVHSDGERVFIHSIGVNAESGIDDIDFEKMRKFHILYVAGTFVLPKFDGKPTEETLKRAKEMGFITNAGIKMGEKGSFIMNEKEKHYFRSWQNPVESGEKYGVKI